MAVRVIEKLAPIIEMTPQEKYSLKTEEDPIAALREKYEFSILSSLYVSTEKLDALKVLKGVYKESAVWKEFKTLLKTYESPVLVFNLKGMGLVVLTRFPKDNPKAGDVRIKINAKETAEDAYIVPFSSYLEFLKVYDD